MAKDRKENLTIAILENGIVLIDITAEVHWRRLVTIAFAAVGVLAALLNLPQALEPIAQFLNQLR